MVIIDYLFFRFYYYYLKNKYSSNESMFTTVCAVAAMIGMLTLGFWGSLIYLFANEIFNYSFLIFSFFAISTYLRYKGQPETLKKRFKDSRWNKYIPNMILVLFILLFSVLGIIIMIPIRQFVWGNFQPNEGRDWVMTWFNG